MERHIQADNAFIKWMEAMSKNVVHIANAWYAAVKWADQHPAWISVEERLPEREEEDPDVSVDVLVTDGKSCYTSYYNFRLKMWKCGEDIIKWAPLPLPPQEEEEQI